MKQKALILSTLITVLLGSSALLTSCKKQPSRSESASQAAEQFYTYLINGQYESFANCVYTPDSMPSEYRLQLAQAVKQYAEKDMRSRGGITDATVIADSIFADSTQAIISLQLTFGDNSTEQIQLPLVYTIDGWKMR